MNEDEKFEHWFARNHPHDWWSEERGTPLPHRDRTLVWQLVREAYFAGVQDARADAKIVVANLVRAEKHLFELQRQLEKDSRGTCPYYDQPCTCESPTRDKMCKRMAEGQLPAKGQPPDDLDFLRIALDGASKALPVLFTMLTTAGLREGATVADEINGNIRSARKRLGSLLEKSSET